MIISNDQLQVFAQAAEDGYVRRAVAHLEHFDPPLAALAERTGLESTARQGLVAARQYGFTEDRNLQLYLELMMTLGSGFDTDPLLRWLHPFLQPGGGKGDVERARLVHFHVLAYLNRAFGPSREFGQVGLQRASTLTLERIAALGQDIDTQAMRLVEWLQPQRIDFLEEAALQELLKGAREEAGQYQLPSGEGTVILFLLKFAFGHRVLTDPLYAWIERPLSAQGPADPAVRLERFGNFLRRSVHAMTGNIGGKQA